MYRVPSTPARRLMTGKKWPLNLRNVLAQLLLMMSFATASSAKARSLGLPLPINRPPQTGTALFKSQLDRPPTKLLTTVRQVQELTPGEAAQHLSVTLRGTLTAFSGWRDYFFLQDASGALAVNRDEHGLLHAGDRVELTGVSEPGLFSISVTSKQVRVLGTGPMPRVQLSTYSDLEGGTHDAEWVKVQGVVQSAQVETIWEKRVLVLNLEMAGRQVSVRVFNFSAEDESRFVDALVRIEGVCGTVYNDKRQFTGLRLFVADVQAIRIEEPAPVDPYKEVTRPIRSVMQFGPWGRARHRVKIAGIVTYQRPHLLYVQDGPDGIAVETIREDVAGGQAKEQGAPIASVPLGARIEAVGFPALHGNSPTLASASFRVVNPEAPPNPVTPMAIHAVDFLQYKDTFAYAPYDGQLVRLTGTVVSPLALPDEDAWLLRDGEGDFVASLQRNRKGSPKVAVGTTLSVTGVMLVVVNADNQPQTFRVLLRGPQDLAVLRPAPWWTPLHLSVVLGVLLLATLAAVLWTQLLRRQVKRQTRLLRESEGRFRSQAQQDTLTGVASRSYLHEQLESAVYMAQQTGGMIGVLMLDLDHFKQINDTLGHHAGDQLLSIVARRIQSAVRRSDIVARMGGDEFVVLLNGIGHASEAETIGAKLVRHVAVPAEIAGQQRSVSASVGVCVYPDGGADGDTLLQHVDEAMYRAKAKGRNSCCCYAAA